MRCGNGRVVHPLAVAVDQVGANVARWQGELEELFHHVHDSVVVRHRNKVALRVTEKRRMTALGTELTLASRSVRLPIFLQLCNGSCRWKGNSLDVALGAESTSVSTDLFTTSS